MHRHVNPVAIPQHSFVASCYCNYAVCFLHLACLLGFVCYWTSASPPWTTTKHHKTRVGRATRCYSAQPPAWSRSINHHQCQSRPAGSAAVPLARKFRHKKHCNIQTTTLPELVTTPGTTQVFTVVWSTLSSSGLPSSRKMSSYWRESSRGLWGWWGDWSMSPVRKDWGSSGCLAWRRLRGDLINACKYLKGGCQEDGGQTLFSGAQQQDKGQRAQTEA